MDYPWRTQKEKERMREGGVNKLSVALQFGDLSRDFFEILVSRSTSWKTCFGNLRKCAKAITSAPLFLVDLLQKYKKAWNVLQTHIFVNLKFRKYTIRNTRSTFVQINLLKFEIVKLENFEIWKLLKL